MKKNYNSLKKLATTTLFLMCIFNSNFTFSQNWQWALSGSGLNQDHAGDVCTDASGNVIMIGSFGSSPFNVAGSSMNNSGASGTDVFVAKYDAAGNPLWAQKIGGTGSESAGGVCTDAAGNIYVTGHYNSPGLSVSPLGVSNYTTNGTYDIFVACFNSFGSIQWLKSYGHLKDDYSSDCTFSNSQSSLYFTGTFNSALFTVGTNTVYNSNVLGSYSDVYVIKLTSGGVATWAKGTGGSGSNDYASGIVMDANQDIGFCGNYNPTTNTTVIGSTTLTSYGGQDMYIAKYNSAGTPLWSRGLGSTNSGSSDFMASIGADSGNNFYINGTYAGTQLIAGTVSLTTSGGYDAFVLKYNTSGTIQWGQKISAAGDEYANGITVDASNNIYFSGAFSGTNLAVGTTTVTNTTPGIKPDVLVIKYSATGFPLWTNTAIGSDYEWGYDISSDAVGNLYIQGTFNIAGPPAFGTTTLSSQGSNDVFLAKIGCAATSIGGSSSVCAGSAATLVASGATSYSWSTGATTTTLVITPTVSGTYSVSGTSGSCAASGSTFSLTVLPATLTPGSNLNLLCKQKQAMNASCNPAATSVTWSPATGLSSTGVLNPTVQASGTPVNYTVSVILNNGCGLSGTVNVSSYAQTPDICMVTADSLGVNNEIYWEKSLYPQADSFIVYREVSLGTYKRIGALNRTAFSMYTDTNRTIGPANGNPNLSYYKYKLQIRDSCGNYSSLGPWHETIFVQDQQNGNFNWNAYAIESTTSPVSTYNLKRRDLSSGIETLIVNTVGSLATDPNYSSFSNTNVKWLVDAVGFNCNPTNKVMLQKVRTKSNQSNDKKFPIGVKENNYTAVNFEVFPNPASHAFSLKINYYAGETLEYEIANVIGQVIHYSELKNQLTNINCSELTSGIYFVNIKQNNKLIATKKVVVE
ncbi:MAG: C-terminal target protein [Bacteroidetes bacterium]|jgi:hypothetical protein|nr:C-terminal target protein [Bacteroidota bacterium]